MDRLSSDVILELITWIGRNELKALRSLNKFFNVTTESVFWFNRFIKLGVQTRKDWERMHVKLGDMRDNPLSARKIQNLTIDLDVNGGGAMDSEEFKKVEQVLSQTLSQLQGLRWQPPRWATESIIQSLAALPLLSRVYIKGWLEHPHPNLPIHHFCHGTLNTLTLGCYINDKDDYFSSLSTVLVHNPNISHLELRASDHLPTPLSFTELFRRQAFSQTLRLQSLKLHGPWHIESAPELTPHIRLLRSLEIFNHQEPTRHTAWEVMRTEKIHLRRSTVSFPHAPLFDYLDTFSGLEALRFLEVRIFDTSLVQRFFQSILPQHAESLKELDIQSWGLALWSVRKWNLDAFNECKELRFLRVEICDKDVNHILPALIKRLVALPRLQIVKIDLAFNYFGEDVSSQARGVLRLMKLKLGPTASLIQVHLGGKVYVPEAVPETAEFIFKPVKLLSHTLN